MHKLLLVGFWILFSSCQQQEATPLQVIQDFPKGLKEVSGIAYSDGLIYALEDSGNPNEVVVLDTLGKIVKTITIAGIANTDWEDLTFDKQGNLYIGDFGNNDNTRQDLAIYKVEKGQLQNNTVDSVAKISFYYPEQTQFPPNKKEMFYDVEAFFVYGDHFYLFTKNRSKGFDGTSSVYKIPNVPGQHRAELVDKIVTCSDYHTCVITSAAISPDGSTFALLSHSKVWLFQQYPKDDITKGKMTELNLHHYSQKEAITFTDNNQVFIADERVKKEGGTLYRLKLR